LNKDFEAEGLDSLTSQYQDLLLGTAYFYLHIARNRRSKATKPSKTELGETEHRQHGGAGGPTYRVLTITHNPDRDWLDTDSELNQTVVAYTGNLTLRDLNRHFLMTQLDSNYSCDLPVYVKSFIDNWLEVVKLRRSASEAYKALETRVVISAKETMNQLISLASAGGIEQVLSLLRGVHLFADPNLTLNEETVALLQDAIRLGLKGETDQVIKLIEGMDLDQILRNFDLPLYYVTFVNEAHLEQSEVAGPIELVANDTRDYLSAS
jgi:hypothetical protein